MNTSRAVDDRRSPRASPDWTTTSRCRARPGSLPPQHRPLRQACAARPMPRWLHRHVAATCRPSSCVCQDPARAQALSTSSSDPGAVPVTPWSGLCASSSSASLPPERRTAATVVHTVATVPITVKGSGSTVLHRLAQVRPCRARKNARRHRRRQRPQCLPLERSSPGDPHPLMIAADPSISQSAHCGLHLYMRETAASSWVLGTVHAGVECRARDDPVEGLINEYERAA